LETATFNEMKVNQPDPEQYRVHESAVGLATPSEHEHDDEHDVSAEALAKVEHD